MSFENPALCAATDGLADVITHVSLHSAAPNSSGSNETTAGRQVPTFGAATGSGDAALSSPLSFTGGAASGACTHYGYWNGSTFLGGFALTGDQTFNAAGEYTITALTLNAS